MTTEACRLEAKGVVVRLGGKLVLSAVSLALRAGEFVALVGPNGAGKTTLIETLAGVRSSDEGEVLLDCVSLSEFTPRKRAQKMALVGREAKGALSLTVREVVTLGRLPYQKGWGLDASDRRLVDSALALHDCERFSNRLLFSLSDGERQRVGWARAEAQEPDVLLLDEATAHLDPKHREESFRRARDFAERGGAVLAIAHDLDLSLRHATQIAVLNEGRLVTQASPRRALSCSILRSVFSLDSEVVSTPRGQGLMTYGVLG